MRASIPTLHRRAGALALVGVVLWGLSGVMHPLMTRLQPRPAMTPAAPAPPVGGGMALRDVLARHAIDRITDARTVWIEQRAAYQVTVPDRPERLYFALADGAPIGDADRRLAQQLARRYAGDTGSAIVDVRLQTQFDADYPYVNRLLPVWRVQFARDDALRAYVDTGSDRLGTLVDDTKAVGAALFGTLHRWDWLAQRAPALHLPLLSAMLVAGLAASALGLWQFARRRAGPTAAPLRRWHRRLGVALAAVAVAFLASGLLHLLHGAARGDPTQRLHVPRPVIDPAVLGIGFDAAAQRAGVATPLRITLAQFGGETWYRVQPAPVPKPKPVTAATPRAVDSAHGAHVPHGTHGAARGTAAPVPVYVSARDGRVLADGEQRHAAALVAQAMPGATVRAIDAVTAFGGEYGFVFKRLPVQRVDVAAEGDPAVYVDTLDGRIAATIDRLDRIEGWTFAKVHKLDGLVPLIGKDARDAVAASLALLLVALALAGGALLVRRLSRPRIRPSSMSLPQTAGANAGVAAPERHGTGR